MSALVKLPADSLSALKADMAVVRKNGPLRRQGLLIRGHFSNRLLLLKKVR